MKNIENRQIFLFNFASLNGNKREMYYEEQKLKNENVSETFVDFIEIESTCKRCEIFFASRNLLHMYILEIKCLKQSNQIFTQFKNQNNIAKIITFTTPTEEQNFELKFRS